MIRKPIQAGRFYPADAVELRRAVREMLDRAGPKPATGSPVGLLAPHAGYRFSGPTAARAFQRIEGAKFERVVVIGPAHYARFAGASTFDGEAYETPLGKIPLDRPLIECLLQRSDLIRFRPEAHAQEHCVEVELPFLQICLKEFRLVPILLGEQSEETALAVADAVGDALDSMPAASTLFVASSDLYHGYDYNECDVMDRRFEATLREFEPRALLRENRSGACMACGAGAVGAAMALARRAGARKAETLYRTNSRDACEMPGSEYIVGYAAAIFR